MILNFISIKKLNDTEMIKTSSDPIGSRVVEDCTRPATNHIGTRANSFPILRIAEVAVTFRGDRRYFETMIFWLPMPCLICPYSGNYHLPISRFICSTIPTFIRADGRRWLGRIEVSTGWFSLIPLVDRENG